ncbi:methyl-accepting chemotaxis protein [Alteromonas sp. KUL49]|nr:methyl-accepting chemotaxis protein [Alteromonas sp. KUL49]
MSLVITTVAAVVSILAVIITSYFSISSMRDEAFQQSQRDLVAKRTLVKQQIEDYFSSIQKQILVMANDISIVEAAQDFALAFEQRPISLSTQSTLKDYYTQDFQRVYDEQNDDGLSAARLLNTLDSTSISLQAAYIGDNVFPLGEKDGLNTAAGSNTYDQLHERYHPTIRQFLNAFGYYDIFIVEPESGYVVYSVFKELDFATSLRTGPYNNSGIAEAFNKALTLSAGQTYLSDFASYVPSYNNPASFISTPIVRDGKTVAVLIFQMPIDRINAIMTQSERWADAGFGESGEIYLVGADNTLRNESRFFVEDQQGYLNVIKQAGITQWTDIEKKGTTISLQPVDTMGVEQALNGRTGFDVFEDYRGVPVLSAYSSVNVLNHQWAIMSEIDEAEAFQSVNGVISRIVAVALIVVCIGLVFAFFISHVFSKQLTKPLDGLANRFADLSQGEADLTVRVPKSDVPEINDIAQSFNLFVQQLQGTVTHVKEAVETIAANGTELSQNTEQTRHTMHEQSIEVSDVKESLGRFGDSVSQITEQTQIAAASTRKAKQTAEQNSERARNAVNNISKLVDEVSTATVTLENLQNSVKDIGEVLSVINSIADQTNLLALNAAIEAARAGEHGRGFAVVADEVRTLASRTQESTVTIQQQIEGLTSSAEHAVSSMGNASSSANNGIQLVELVQQTLDELTLVVVEIAALNQNITQSSEVQSETISEINANVENLERRANEMADSTRINSNVANQLSGLSEQVQTSVNRFVV